VGKRVDELMVDLGLNGTLVKHIKDEAGSHTMTATCDAQARLPTERGTGLRVRSL
jgi:hypothetical protein